MKVILVLMLCALAAAAPKVEKENPFDFNDVSLAETSLESRNILVNLLVRQLFAYLRHVINNGSFIFGIPPLDPLSLEHYQLSIPAGLINLDLTLDKVIATGAGDFVLHKSNLNLSDLTLDVDISVPRLDISAEQYDLIGDLFTAIPLYGKGGAVFQVDSFRFQALFYLKQSDNEKAVIIDRIENASFQLPHLKSELSGVIGGGDIDAIVNAVIEEVIVDYANRFQGAISIGVAHMFQVAINPLLDQLDTWKYIARLL